MGDLTKWKQQLLGIGPSVTWPVFNAGRIRANIAATDERSQQAAAGYEQAVLTALEDVENALVNYAREQERRELLRRRRECKPDGC